jgi:hypothetical protein
VSVPAPLPTCPACLPSVRDSATFWCRHRPAHSITLCTACSAGALKGARRLASRQSNASSGPSVSPADHGRERALPHAAVVGAVPSPTAVAGTTAASDNYLNIHNDVESADAPTTSASDNYLNIHNDVESADAPSEGLFGFGDDADGDGA